MRKKLYPDSCEGCFHLQVRARKLFSDEIMEMGCFVFFDQFRSPCDRKSLPVKVPTKEELFQRIADLETALGEYADPEHWNGDVWWHEDGTDGPEIASKALKGKK